MAAQVCSELQLAAGRHNVTRRVLKISCSIRSIGRLQQRAAKPESWGACPLSIRTYKTSLSGDCRAMLPKRRPEVVVTVLSGQLRRSSANCIRVPHPASQRRARFAVFLWQLARSRSGHVQMKCTPWNPWNLSVESHAQRRRHPSAQHKGPSDALALVARLTTNQLDATVRSQGCHKCGRTLGPTPRGLLLSSSTSVFFGSSRCLAECRARLYAAREIESASF
ncbi:hypothetical protein B0T24DRAFT_145364 [Lasiosphaeria ovina]|uniref:Uncharacterized protein n=1 Tax=Lasiosphaeria ovina TaxID=92902 RepID=A0AAE0KLX2_9PEZI|nr:hypothetical protein B0T24DRAFT_145364 [Lasiosphaeria ovina]